jgi:hypothetical protein
LKHTIGIQEEIIKVSNFTLSYKRRGVCTKKSQLENLFRLSSLAAIHDGFSPSWSMNHGCDLAVHREKDSGTQRG